MPDTSSDPPAEPPSPPPKFPFDRDFITTLVPILIATVAVLSYSVLIVGYNLFYDQFGLNPEEIGYGYTDVLRGSVGLVAFVVGCVLAASIFGILISGSWLPSSWQDTNRPDLIGLIKFILGCILGLAVVLAVFVLPRASVHRAEEARQGIPVTKYRIGPFNLLPFQALSASVQPSEVSSQTATVEALSGRPLLYLGQANAAFIIYDSSTEQTIRLPASSVILTTHDCRETNPFADPFACIPVGPKLCAPTMREIVRLQ